MSAILRLTEKSTGELFTGMSLIEIDNVMCLCLGVVPDRDHWYKNWMNMVGVSLAFGRTFDEMRDDFSDYPKMLEVINWIDTYFVNSSYCGR